MIKTTQLGTLSVIREVLGLIPKEIPIHELTSGEYFEDRGRIFIYIGDGYAIDQEGAMIIMGKHILVRPVNVKLEFEYILLNKKGDILK